MLPWLANVELVDLSNSFPTPPELNIETEEEEEETDAMSPVKLEGEGWGSVEATQLVLNNLFYITVKVSATFYIYYIGISCQGTCRGSFPNRWKPSLTSNFLCMQNDWNN